MHIKWPAINFEGSAESVDERKTRLPLLSPSSSFPSTSLSLSLFPSVRPGKETNLHTVLCLRAYLSLKKKKKM